MATVVVTFFLITRISVCKMDADFKEKRRERISSQREKRWSMNSQRLEEIVAELMRPISDLRHNFDTDLSALLEEYLTEAGLHALEAEEGSGAGAGEVAPNFAELALLLQQSASIYGRKVDFLYQHVLSVSDSLHNSTIEITNTSTEQEQEQEAQTPTGGGRRKRKASVSCDFTHIEVESSAAARRDAEAPPRPPPTLPRMYLELEPRVMADHDVPLLDYCDEPIGLLTDFHVSWRLQDGRLTEELSGSAGSSAQQLRAIPLLELQAAIEAHAPPALPSPPPSPTPAPRACSTPLPDPDHEPEPEPEPEMPPPVLPLRKERKRKSELKIDDLIGGSVKLLISKELSSRLGSVEEFVVPREWVAQTVRARCRDLRALRARLHPDDTEFRGFDFSCLDVSGFSGWSSVEASIATERARDSLRLTRLHSDSDDDGFFEQSSLADSDASCPLTHTHTHTHGDTHLPASTMCAEWESWRAGVVRRAAEQEARGGVDVRALASTVLRALPAPPRPAPRPFTAVLAACAAEHNDVSRLFLATLFLANAGNVEVIRGEPLSLDSFSVRLVSADAALYCAAADAEGDLFR